MNRFVAFVLALWLGLVFALASDLALAQREPLSLFAQVFLTDPDGALCRPPCLLGIRPGLTTFDAGVALVRAHPMSRYLVMPMEKRMTGWPGRNYNLVLGRYDSREQVSSFVTSISVDFSDYTPGADSGLHVTFGEVVHFLGTPDAVYKSSQLAWLYYPAQRLIITIKLAGQDVAHLEATDPVVAVLLPDEFAYAELAKRLGQ